MYLLKAYIIVAAASLCVIANAEGKFARGGEAANRTCLRIVEVFNTTQRLWLYQQNYSNDIFLPDGMTLSRPLKEECIFLKKHNITQDDYYYWRKSNIANQWARSPLHGRFFSDVQGGLGSMNVSVLSGNDTTPFEVMKLMYSERNCSVFFVTPLEEDAETVCELYVRNKAVSRGPTENCTNYYNKHCNATIVVYDSTCQSKSMKKVVNKKGP
ncbi:uncharacterized protein LOC142564631 [Dermacentor variabilis]|uniref:uncharacterized protein LOC142564631 n=1 Tax=Dermacentor variabilis TaxID=34621 RepID=UPI003F5C4DEC